MADCATCGLNLRTPQDEAAHAVCPLARSRVASMPELGVASIGGRLVDLEPQWYSAGEGSERLGLTFLCPHCREQHLGVAFHHLGHEAMDDAVIRARIPGDSRHIWTLVGGEDFATLTLTPSIDASHHGHWHGFITNGEIR